MAGLRFCLPQAQLRAISCLILFNYPPHELKHYEDLMFETGQIKDIGKTHAIEHSIFKPDIRIDSHAIP